jgi:hypothetical protein
MFLGLLYHPKQDLINHGLFGWKNKTRILFRIKFLQNGVSTKDNGTSYLAINNTNLFQTPFGENHP